MAFESRCADCLQEFAPAARRFVVLKRDTSRSFNEEERRMSADVFEAVVCEGCAVSYGGDYFEIE